MLQPQMTNRYFITRICKSKDATDLFSALGAYLGFVKFRRDYSTKMYFNSAAACDPAGMAKAVAINFV